MDVGRHIFTGTAGVYYVMYRLTAEGFHASCTHGNAPNIDILVSSADGSRFVSIEVKTTEYALRLRGRGAAKQAHHLEFPLGARAAKLNNPLLVIAFVDLRGLPGEHIPDVYLFPSAFVARFCKDWVDSARMVRFHIPIADAEPYKNEWKIIRDTLAAASTAA